MVKKIIYLLLIIGFVSCINTTDKSSNTQIDSNIIKVALFNGNGASTICVAETFEALKIDKGISTKIISAREISAGELDDFDVIIFPGGSASKELNNLGHSAVNRVVDFVKAGNGAVGICAGGYLFSTTKDYPSLKLISATEWDREHYNKGRALVEFELTTDGEKIFPELANKKSFLQYYDGPVLMPADSNENGIFKYSEFAKYVTDIQIHKGYPKGVTPSKTFLLGESIGDGKAIVVAGHPESTPGMRWMVSRLARWAVDKELIEYSAKWVRPDIYTHEILFKKDKRKLEKDSFWKLFNEDYNQRTEAMQLLWELHSRPAVRWNIGMLRDSIPEVRAKAAHLLMQAEYSLALPDLQYASKIETDTQAKSAIDKAIVHLSDF